MTDRELLELAAKAAGIEHLSSEYYVSGPELWDIERKRWWRPLTNDGDALRLAVQLGLIVCVMNGAHFTGIYISSESPCGKYDEVEHHGECALAATRRAIVRAAAQIGAQM